MVNLGKAKLTIQGVPVAVSNISISHAETGLVRAEVAAAEQISPHFVRLTIAGRGLAGWRHLGFDQWFRLAVPLGEATSFDRLAPTFNTAGYLKYLALPRGSRPAMRNYTVRNYRPDSAEMDIDFVIHGEAGVAGPWARSLPLGAPVAIIDQGCGYRTRAADSTLLVGDETALPAIAGILRDMPRETRGTAIIEVPELADQQDTGAPEHMDVQWIARADGQPAGQAALDRLRSLAKPEGSITAFAAGESSLATGARRHLVHAWGVPKPDVTFCGYWRNR